MKLKANEIVKKVTDHLIKQMESDDNTDRKSVV